MGTRGKGDIDTGCNNLGFRCVKDATTNEGGKAMAAPPTSH
jgi:hypothetical protein